MKRLENWNLTVNQVTTHGLRGPQRGALLLLSLFHTMPLKPHFPRILSAQLCIAAPRVQQQPSADPLILTLGTTAQRAQQPSGSLHRSYSLAPSFDKNHTIPNCTKPPTNLLEKSSRKRRHGRGNKKKKELIVTLTTYNSLQWVTLLNKNLQLKRNRLINFHEIQSLAQTPLTSHLDINFMEKYSFDATSWVNQENLVFSYYISTWNFLPANATPIYRSCGKRTNVPLLRCQKPTI